MLKNMGVQPSGIAVFILAYMVNQRYRGFPSVGDWCKRSGSNVGASPEGSNLGKFFGTILRFSHEFN